MPLLRDKVGGDGGHMTKHTGLRLLAVSALLMGSGAAQALSFSVPLGDEDSVEGVLNTTITFGAQWRTQDRSNNLIGKGNINPNLCGRAADGAPFYQSCQGLFRDQGFTAARAAGAPGQFSMNADDGNLNYDKGDITQAPLKVTQDLNLTWGDFGFFGKVLFFYDFVNNDFTENHPNWITRDNYLQAGTATSDTPPRTDSVACPDGRDSDDNPLTPCNIVYGAGLPVKRKRTDGETLRQIGTDLQMLDGYFYGKLPLPGEKQLTFKIGRQTVNWGESTLLAFGSINQANPINANNFFRLGFAVEEVFTPLGMVFLSMEPFENTTLEGFYEYEWKPLEAPAYGSFYSFADIGSYNGGPDVFNVSFGTNADDVDRDPNAPTGGYGRLFDNPLSGLTNTTVQGQRLRDNEPSDSGQFGISFKYYAEWLNNGTELGLYFMNYHSRIPYVSTYTVPTSCAKETTSSSEFLMDCSDIPLLYSITTEPGNPVGATSTAVNFDDLRIQLEYPEDIQMYGISFNTTVGDLSLQGEVAYRPDEPMQVALVDLVFGAFGSTLSNCHLESAGCFGSTSGTGTDADGSTITYSPSDYITDAGGTPGAFLDTYDLAVGHMSGSGRSFPSFIIPYRNRGKGLEQDGLGQNRGCIDDGHYNDNTVLNAASPCYIRGWEYLDSYQFNLGGTYVAGATERLSQVFGADQVILLFETGATWVPDLPDLNVLQFEAPGLFTHASAGADGTGGFYTDEASRRQACSTNEACSFGVDGLRFNPSQQDLDMFPDRFSWGYDIIALIRYESVLPGISLQPIILWKHDVNGTAPGIATNFSEGRKTADVSIEMRYKSNFSFNVAYQWWFGGGLANLYRDRDSARAWIKVQF